MDDRSRASARPEQAPRLGERSSGVLLHLTSLPGPYGIGDLGAGARRFADFLAAAGQRWWQMLPVGPTGYGDSPYSAESAFAGSPLLLDLDALAADGLIQPDALEVAALPGDRADYGAAAGLRGARLREAAAVFAARLAHRPDERARFEAFCEERRGWLDDFALYRAIKREAGGAAWTAWDRPLRAREPAALERARGRLSGELAQARFEQYVFARQFAALRGYAAARGVGLLGDAPIFVAHDSADVWQHQALFRLDAQGLPEVIAGVPPDYFSKTGQRWGNPLYQWDELERHGYGWWIARIRAALERFDAVRLDHFIGFTRAWEIPRDQPTAEVGRWISGPGPGFFTAVRAALGIPEGGALPFVAEDLGVVTPEVEALRDRFGLPGMRVLQFAFGADPSGPGFLPHAYPRRTVAYTGTHDNDTAVGWFADPGGGPSPRSPAQAARERLVAMSYLPSDGRDFPWDMIRAALASVADTAVVPLQDLLGLGSEARMNRPGVAEGNWTWRFRGDALSRGLAERLGRLARLYGRTPEDPRELGAPACLGGYGDEREAGA